MQPNKINGDDLDAGRATQSDGFDTPVALCIYHRPEFTRRLIDALRPIRPRHILVVADGPNPARAHDDVRCQQARAAISQIDWPCEVHWNTANTNLGFRKRIQSGLNWVFESVEEAIILEDDCIPDPTFFLFCREMLSRYKNEQKVLVVAGMAALSGTPRGPESYQFSIHPNCHGWATWRRAWAIYEADVKSWPALRSTKWLRNIVGNRRDERFWRTRFDLARGDFDAWDFSLVFSCWKVGGLSIRPRHDLVQNIGFGTEGTHTLDPEAERAKRRVRPMAFPLIHPSKIDDWRVARNRARTNAIFSRLQWRVLCRSALDKVSHAVASAFGPADRSERLRRIFRYNYQRSAQVTVPWLKPGTLDFADARVGNAAFWGWSFPEKAGRWTTGMQACLRWRIDSIENDITCCVDATPALHGSQPKMTVDVFVNDVRCARSIYGGDDRDGVEHSPITWLKVKFARHANAPLDPIERFRIPGPLLSGNDKMVMTFFVRWPLVPADHEISDDIRALGLFVRTIRFERLMPDNDAGGNE